MLALSSAGAADSRRAGLGVGLVIVPECPPAASTASEGAVPRDPQAATGARETADPETLRHCNPAPARVASQPHGSLRPPPPPEARARDAVLIEY